jgi:hypothetical protein
MKLTRSLAILLLATASAPGLEGPSSLVELKTLPVRDGQDWLGEPRLPEHFRTGRSFQARSGQESEASNPLRRSSDSTSQAFTDDSALPKGITALDIQAWREEEDLRQIRAEMADAIFGIPLLGPQLLLEAVLPRGLAVGPTTFLYRTSSGSSSLALVVLDQVLFHEAAFLSRAQSQASDGLNYTDNLLLRGQRHVLRQSFMIGFRATYALPHGTLDTILESAADQGLAGYLLVPPAGCALLYLKGIDERVRIDEHVNIRFKVASGSQWIRGARSTDGVPAFSLELRLFDLPVSIIASFDVSDHGMIPAFIGLGTSLDVVEDLLGIESARSSLRTVR